MVPRVRSDQRAEDTVWGCDEPFATVGELADRFALCGEPIDISIGAEPIPRHAPGWTDCEV